MQVSEGVTGAPTHQILAKNLEVVGSGYDLFRKANVEAGMAAIKVHLYLLHSSHLHLNRHSQL